MDEQQHDWAAIKHAYLDGDETVNEICRKFNINRSCFYRTAKRENWPQRQTKDDPQTNFVEQMFRVLSRQLDQVNKRISPDSAVDATALGNIAKTYEKLVELERSENSTADQSGDKSASYEQLRNELAARLAELGSDPK